MSSPFGARRKARAIGQDNESSDSMPEASDQDPESLFKRPTNRSKKRSSMRISFGAGDEEEEGHTEVFTPKKSNLSRQVSERNALRKTASLASLKQTDSATASPVRVERPSYDKQYLAELKKSTPSTPVSERGNTPQLGTAANTTLDIASKFGSDLTRYERQGGTSIPTETEIQEKKARRARLAKEQKYKPLDASDEDESGAFSDSRDHDSDEDEFRSQRDIISLQDKPSKHATSAPRLEADDDEDLLDDSVHYGTPGRIHIGRAAEKQRAARERVQRAEQIENAQQSSSESSSGDDEGEQDRRVAYDDAQTRDGMAGLQLDSTELELRERSSRARTPPKMTPIPTFAGILEKFNKRAQELEEGNTTKIKGLEEAERERLEISEQEEAVQKLLDEVVAKWEELNGTSSGDVDMDSDDEEDERSGLGGAGLGAGSRGTATGLGGSVASHLTPSTFGTPQGLRFTTSLGGTPNLDGQRGLESLGGTPMRSGTPSRSTTVGLDDVSSEY